MIKRSFALAGHRTSVALEMEFWQALADEAVRHGSTLAALVARIDAARTAGHPLAYALRLHALANAQSRPPESSRA